MIAIAPLLSDVLAAVAVAAAVSFYLPPVQWLKNKLWLSQDHHDDLATITTNISHRITVMERLQLFFSKLLNCGECCGWWSGILISLANHYCLWREPIMWLNATLAGVLASIIAEILYRFFRPL